MEKRHCGESELEGVAGPEIWSVVGDGVQDVDEVVGGQHEAGRCAAVEAEDKEGEEVVDEEGAADGLVGGAGEISVQVPKSRDQFPELGEKDQRGHVRIRIPTQICAR